MSVLDFTNPFSVGLGLPLPRGGNSLNGFGHTFNESSHLPAESMLGDVHVVMDPKWHIDPRTSATYHALYRSYIAANFQIVRETEFWTIYARRGTASATGSGAVASDQGRQSQPTGP